MLPPLQISFDVRGSDNEAVSYTITCPSQTTACPDEDEAPPCPMSCGGDNGVCVRRDGKFACECKAGWGGPSCSQYQCSGNECTLADDDMGNARTELHGECVRGGCECDAGYTGVDCRVPEPACSLDCAALVRSAPAAELAGAS